MEPEYAAEKDLLKGEMKRERKGFTCNSVSPIAMHFS